MQIFVKGLTGRTFTLDVEPRYRVARVKYMIAKVEDVKPEHQRLIFRGFQLQDKKPLSFYGVRKESTLHLGVHLRGC
jgi:hypothetical protein